MASRYTEGLKDLVITPTVLDDVEPVYHLYVILVEQRDVVQKRLAERGIFSGIHYPTPIPFLDAFSYLHHTPDDFPVAYGLKDKLLSLPMHGDLTDDQVDYVIQHVRAIIEML